MFKLALQTEISNLVKTTDLKSDFLIKQTHHLNESNREQIDEKILMSKKLLEGTTHGTSQQMEFDKSFENNLKTF